MIVRNLMMNLLMHMWTRMLSSHKTKIKDRLQLRRKNQKRALCLQKTKNKCSQPKWNLRQTQHFRLSHSHQSTRVSTIELRHLIKIATVALINLVYVHQMSIRGSQFQQKSKKLKVMILLKIISLRKRFFITTEANLESVISRIRSKPLLISKMTISSKDQVGMTLRR